MNTAINSLKLGKVNSKTKVNAKDQPFWKSVKWDRAIALKVSALLIIIGIIGLGAYRVIQINSGKILPRIRVAGVAVGGKTPAEAKTMIQARVDALNAQGVQITYDTQKLNPKLAEMGVAFNVDRSVNDAYNFGRSGKFLTKLADNSKMIVKNYNISLIPLVDNEKMNSYLGQISNVVTVTPVNAGLAIDASGNITDTPPQNGRGFDKNKLKNDINTIVNQNKLGINNITLVTSVLTPDVLASGTASARAQAQKFMSAAPIVSTYNGDNYTASKGDIGTWIAFSASGNQLVATISDGQLNSWINSRIVKKIAIQEIDEVTIEGTGQVLDEGNDGLGVESKGLAAALKSRALLGTPGEAITINTYVIPKGHVTKNPHAQPCRYTGHYVDINLSEQTLYAFDGCTLVNQFLISSGKTGPTPTGEFHVYSKSRVTRMTGPGYDLPGVEWVSWFSGDYSIHGTYWHNNFGHPMSHGCVNASNGNAEWLYGWDEVGTPVYIH